MKKYFYTLFLIIFINWSCSKSAEMSSNSASQGKSGSIARMTISNNHLYTVDKQSLKVFDIRDAQNMVLLNKQDIGFNIETIFPYNDKLFIGSSSAMFVYDISNPQKPVQQGIVSHIRSCDPVVADDNYAYVTLRNNNTRCGGTANVLNIYNISGGNILIPKIISSIALPQPYGLSVLDNTVYVCLGEKGLAIVDVTDKSKPDVITVITLGKSYTDVIAYDNTLIAYVQGGIAIFDISQRNRPTLLSEITN